MAREYKYLEAITAFPSIVLEELVKFFVRVWKDERNILR